MLALNLDVVGSISASLRFLCSARELPQDLSGKHTTAEVDSLVHQLDQQPVADRRQVLQGDDKLALLKVRSGLFGNAATR